MRSDYDRAYDLSREFMIRAKFIIISGDLDKLARAALRDSRRKRISIEAAIAAFPLFASLRTEA